MIENLRIPHWSTWIDALALSRDTLERLAIQIVLIAVLLGLALLLRRLTRPLADRVFTRGERYLDGGRVQALRGLLPLAYAWLLLVIAERAAPWFKQSLPLVGVAATLVALWIVLRASALLFRDAMIARLVAAIAWIIAALDITGLLPTTAAALDSVALTLGAVRLSLLLVVKAVVLIALLLWAALALARLTASRLRYLALTPSVQSLADNVVRIVLVSLALLIGLNAVGIDLTALAVFSGAIGVGIGLGLQKVVSNFVSGIVLLLEQSIKPGDVIEVGHAHGSVTALGARYTSVRGRDGKEYLIPNESLITNEVVNWSYSSPLLRLDLAFGVAYGSDLRAVRRLAVEAASQTDRVVASPVPVCHITEFADSGINLMLRFWIEDPANGVVNVKGDVFLALWDALCENGIEVPSPQRVVHIRELPPELLQRRETRRAAE